MGRVKVRVMIACRFMVTLYVANNVIVRVRVTVVPRVTYGA